MAKRILVVDDEPEILELLRIRLGKEGYEVITCSTGEDCIRKAEELQPDLIMLDVLLPGLSGYEVSRRLKANVVTKDIPIIMVTALMGEDAEAKGIQRGAEFFISKPFDPEELLTRVKALIGN